MPNLSCYTMQVPIQHMYKPSHEGSGLLYAWFLSMHTRVDIILYSKKTEGELLFVVNCIYDALCRLEKMANFYNPVSELAYVNRTAFVSPVVLSEELYSMIYVWNIMGRLWGVLILQSIQKITIRTRYNRSIYQLKIIVSIFRDRELLSTYLVSSKGMLWKQLKAY